MKLEEFKYQYGYPHALFLKLITGHEEAGVKTEEYLPEQCRFPKVYQQNK